MAVYTYGTVHAMGQKNRNVNLSLR